MVAPKIVLQYTVLEVDGSQTMHTESERDLTTVMHIMFDQMPDDPLARKGFFLSIVIGIVKNFLQVSNRPTLKGILNHLPSRFQSAG